MIGRMIVNGRLRDAVLVIVAALALGLLLDRIAHGAPVVAAPW